MSARCTPPRADRRLVQLDYLAPAVERVHPREDLVLGHLATFLEKDQNVDVTLLAPPRRMTLSVSSCP